MPDDLAKTGDFWLKYNKPFLDTAIERGDDIVLATKPIKDNMFFKGELTGFGREIEYLQNMGYRYDEAKNMMTKQ